MTNPAKPDTSSTALEILKLLADDTRWSLIGALRHSDRQANELAALCRLPNNLVSYHLGLLRQAGLVKIHRSEADARVLYYGLDLAALEQAYRQIGAALPLPPGATSNLSPARTVVFLCTNNSARSQMAEGWLRFLGGSAVIARSAGTKPTAIHPLAIQTMAEAGVDIGYQRSKGLDSLETTPDIVVTVCDVAREECPAELQKVPFIHWSIADPARVTGSETERLEVFRNTRELLKVRVQGLLGSAGQLASFSQA